MSPQERDPKFLIANNYLERCADFEHDGQPVLASRLGWRITARFVQAFCGRVFGNPSSVFAEDFLRPEQQDLAVFATGMANIVEAMRSAAERYFNDGSIEQACPPLKGLLHIMRDGTWEGRNADDPTFRALFSRESLLASDWYAARLEAQREVDSHLWERHARYLEKFLQRTNYADVAAQLDIRGRLERVARNAEATRQPGYAKSLTGTLGAEPFIAAELNRLSLQ
jgi:hypothetical protein